jgi:hypothetical protein
MRGSLLLALVPLLACGGRDAQAPTSGSDAGALTCDEQSAAGRLALNAAVAAVQDDVSCSTDSDCTEVSTQTVCFGAECGGVVVNQAGAAQLAATIAKINATTCESYAANGCSVQCCPNCPPFLYPSCVAGTCQD